MADEKNISENTSNSSVKTQEESKQKHKQHVEKESAPVSMRQLLESGVHFGHQTRRWNPKMKKFIFTARNDIHVIDLQQTLSRIKIAYEFIKNLSLENKNVLFVGTKKQAQKAISEEAIRCEMPYVNQRWLGGTLTNNLTIRKSINKLHSFEMDKENGVFDKLSKKEASRKTKKLGKLKFYLDGIKDMKKLPGAVFIIDTKKEQLAIKEAQKLGIPIIGLVDTNADPTEAQYPIPGNDDAIRAIKLVCSIMANAVLDGQKKQILDKVETKEIEKELEETETQEIEKEKPEEIKAEQKNEPMKETPKEATEEITT